MSSTSSLWTTTPLVMSPHPFIIVLSFGHEASVETAFAPLLDILRVHYEVIHYGLSNQRIVELLPSPDLKGIIVTHPAIMNDENAALLSRLVQHVTAYNASVEREGNKIIFAGFFSNSAKSDEILPFFSTHWGLQWEAGTYKGMDVSINMENELAALNQTILPSTFAIKAVHLAGVTPETAVYTPATRSYTYAPLIPEEANLCAVAYAKVGEGWLGYIGGVNPGLEYKKIVMCMLGSGR